MSRDVLNKFIPIHFRNAHWLIHRGASGRDDFPTVRRPLSERSPGGSHTLDGASARLSWRRQFSTCLLLKMTLNASRRQPEILAVRLWGAGVSDGSPPWAVLLQRIREPT
jgi:hypothetical protein